MARLNAVVIRHERDERSLTACLVWLTREDAGVTAVVVRGGHPLPLVLRTGGEVEEVAPQGPLIGILESARFASKSMTLADGDSLVLYTDGVTEARTPGGELYGEGRLANALRSARHRSAQAITDTIVTDVHRFQTGPARDDIAILVVKASAAVRPYGVSAAARPGTCRETDEEGP